MGEGESDGKSVDGEGFPGATPRTYMGIYEFYFPFSKVLWPIHASSRSCS